MPPGPPAYGPPGHQQPQYQPPPQKSTNTLKVVLIVLGVLALLGIGGCVACVAIVGTGVNEASKEIDEELNKSSITKDQFNSIELGTSQSAVIEELGPPADKQTFENEGVLDKEPQGSSCIYYNEADDFASSYQFCFTESKLDSKNQY